jgi:hypothetical protein
MLATKAMTQASYGRMSALSPHVQHVHTHDTDGDGGQGKRVADDAADAEGGGALAGVAIAVSRFHLQRGRVGEAVRGHVRARLGAVRRCGGAACARQRGDEGDEGSDQNTATGWKRENVGASA